ncbi:MAG: pyruvate kinase [Puniceicoccaceae bacterium]
MPKSYRHTKIIFTIGPATESEEQIARLIKEGVDVCRINMAHADHDWTRTIVDRIRRVGKAVGREIATMMDVKGPEIRTGALEEAVHLREGQTIDLIVEGESGWNGDTFQVPVNYPKLPDDLSPGDTVLVDNGLMRFSVTGISEGRIHCEVSIGGRLGSKRHINLPGVRVSLPCLTQKDRADVRVGVEAGVDLFALSFVREADDIDVFRRYLQELNSEARIIAKIEDQQGIANLDDIITASDGIMVARGDLGIECPFEEIPIIQQLAVEKCIRSFKPAIVATHMLESMTNAPVPTRAEVADVAHAVNQQTDCLMLSGETTVGEFPIECVRVFKKISERVEAEQKTPPRTHHILKSSKDKMIRSAVILAHDLDNAAILVFTRSGQLAQLLSSLRPLHIPIFAFTDNPVLFRQLLMVWGVEPFIMEFSEERDVTITRAINTLMEGKWVTRGDCLVTITNVLRRSKIIHTVQLRHIESETLGEN